MQIASKNFYLLLFVAIVFAGSMSGNTSAAQEFDTAFDSSGLPWYDSETKDLKSTNAPWRRESTVSDRNRIPPKVKKKKGQQVTKPQAPPTATGTGNTASAAGTSIIYIIGSIAALLLIAALIYGFLKLESNNETGEENEKRNRRIRDHIKHLPFELEEQDGDFETFAEKSLREGDYSNAVIYLFADLLVAMSESGVVRLQRGKTNRQYMNDIWDHQEIRPYFQKVMTAFEDAFFGKHEISQSRAEDCFGGRAAFDAGLEKIRKARYDAQHSPALPPPTVSMEGVS